jgi:outer membrane immunogenic protein
MTRFKLFPLLAATVAFSATAQAADLGQAPIYGPGWTGFYIGAHGGYATADFDFHTPITGTPSEKDKGGFGGIQAGYNWQGHSNFVVGLEADVSFGDLKDKVPDGNFIKETTEINAFGSARARLGYSFGRFLPYVTGGLSWADATLGETCPPGAQFGHCRPAAAGAYSLKDSEVFFGWTAGGGAEVAITPKVSLKAEYLYSDLGSQWFQFNGPASPRAPNLTIETVRAGINYHFGDDYVPLK